MKRPVPILLYHSVDESCSSRYAMWNVPPKTFARHMQLLASEGYTPITVSSLMRLRQARQPLGERKILITFDDGLRDFLTGALPVLSRHGFSSTLYVVSGLLGSRSVWLEALGEGDRRMLSKEELLSVAAENVEIGGHTHTHPQLDLLSESGARNEIFRSKAVLEDVLGQKVRSFAYPHGYASDTTRRLVHEAGYESACRVGNAMSEAGENPFALTRMNVHADLTDERFLALVRGEGIEIAPPLETFPIKGWRLVRRVKQIAGLKA